jgi:hypothetical protein
MNLWKQEGVPHKGWTIDDHFVMDYYTSCEMCGKERICFVYRMSHPDYPTYLDVGCVCAENMSEDYINPRLMQKNLKNKIKHRSSWINRCWNVSKKGNEYNKLEGRVVVILKKPNYKFSYCVDYGDKYFCKTIFDCALKAKEAAFDYVNNTMDGYLCKTKTAGD